MYAHCLMIAHTETEADQEMISIKHKDNLTSYLQVEETNDFKENVRVNEKFLGGSILHEAQSKIDQIKYHIPKDL